MKRQPFVAAAVASILWFSVGCQVARSDGRKANVTVASQLDQRLTSSAPSADPTVRPHSPRRRTPGRHRPLPAELAELEARLVARMHYYPLFGHDSIAAHLTRHSDLVHALLTEYAEEERTHVIDRAPYRDALADSVRGDLTNLWIVPDEVLDSVFLEHTQRINTFLYEYDSARAGASERAAR